MHKWLNRLFMENNVLNSQGIYKIRKEYSIPFENTQNMWQILRELKSTLDLGIENRN